MHFIEFFGIPYLVMELLESIHIGDGTGLEIAFPNVRLGYVPQPTASVSRRKSTNSSPHGANG